MTVRFVVLGCGRIGSMHAAYLHRRVAGAEVVGVFDVVAEAATNVGAELGVPVAADLEAALAIDADAVAICTSTDTHVDVMIAAAEAGRLHRGLGRHLQRHGDPRLRHGPLCDR